MKKEFKGFVCGVLATAIVGLGVASASGVWDNISVLRNDISVVVNGKSIIADNFLYEDTTYLPLRAVSEALNQEVSYDENTNTAYIGERNDNTMIRSKYTPSQEFLNNKDMVYLDDGIYYVTTYFLETMIGEKPNYDSENNMYVFKFKDGTEKKYNLHTWNMRSGLPYDIFVDEIEPLLK